MTGDDQTKRALDALQEFEERCKSAANKSPVDRMREETEAFEELVDTLAGLYAAGMTTPPASQAAGTVGEVTNSLTKTDAKQAIASASQDAKLAASGHPRVDEWVEENLEQVRVVRSTDHVADTRYVWDFGAVTLETESGDEGRAHYHWNNFKESIYDADGPYLEAPQDYLRDIAEWKPWIIELLEEHKDRKTFQGPRTQAVRVLQNRVRNADAFGSLSDAINYNGVYVEVVEEPPDDKQPVDKDASPQELPAWRVDVLYIPGEWASDAADDHGIAPQSLQNEIDARGYTTDMRGRVSTQEWVDGSAVTFWVLDGDFATPAAYQPEGQAKSHVGVDALDPTDSAADDPETGSIGGTE